MGDDSAERAASVGAIGARQQLEGLAEDALTTRLLVATRGVVFYLWKLVWPSWLSPFYPLSDSVSLGSEEFLVPVLFCVGGDRRGGVGAEADASTAGGVGSYLALLLPGVRAGAGRRASGGRPLCVSGHGAGAVGVVAGMLWMWRREPVGGQGGASASPGRVADDLGSRTRSR